MNINSECQKRWPRGTCNDLDWIVSLFGLPIIGLMRNITRRLSNVKCEYTQLFIQCAVILPTCELWNYMVY